MSWVRYTIIVTAANQPLAQSLCAGLAGDSGAGMFTTALSASGQAAASHYISTGCIQQEFAALMQDANAMFAAAQQAGASVTLAQCQALVGDSTVQDAEIEGPFATMARLGLVMIEPPGDA